MDERPRQHFCDGRTGRARLGQTSWAVYEWGRTPYVLLVYIYLFSPYFARVVVGNPVKGQALWGAIAAIGGLIVAALAPFLGAIADAGGRRKPWIALLYGHHVASAMLTMWFAKPHASGLGLRHGGRQRRGRQRLVSNSPPFSTMRCCRPSRSPNALAGLSGLGLSLGNAAGILLLLFHAHRVCAAGPCALALHTCTSLVGNRPGRA